MHECPAVNKFILSILGPMQKNLVISPFSLMLIPSVTFAKASVRLYFVRPESLIQFLRHKVQRLHCENFKKAVGLLKRPKQTCGDCKTQ
jgi:hypothetical protein